MSAGTGLFVVFKFDTSGDLDTTSYNGSYRRKPPARTYNTVGHTKAQWQRFRKQGFHSRAAEIYIDENGEPKIVWIDQDWVEKKELCGHTQRVDSPEGKFWGYRKCKLEKDHDGLHK